MTPRDRPCPSRAHRQPCAFDDHEPVERSRRRAADGAGAWTASRGVAVRQVLHPEPETMADFNRRIDQPRTVLTLRGAHAGKRVELQLVERVFDLQRGFHLRQEYRYGR